MKREEGGRGPLVILGLGSNLGDRMGFLRNAARGLSTSGFVLNDVSSVYETSPVGFLEQPFFLNLVLSGYSEAAPLGVLDLCARLETEAGRVRSFSNAPRPLDVDLLFVGSRILRLLGLQVPHPRWRERSFVVRPLQEIHPRFRDPETGWRVEEVARWWPSQPEDVPMVMERGAFLAMLDEGGT
jgi:2-amino-4-hydroxy-6-hydroxymethyldihydropteridine diphosphokinase